jgi:hypothetical protein
MDAWRYELIFLWDIELEHSKMINFIVSARPCIIFYLSYTYRDLHAENLFNIFSFIYSSQPIRLRVSFLHVWEKRYVQSEAAYGSLSRYGTATQCLRICVIFFTMTHKKAALCGRNVLHFWHKKNTIHYFLITHDAFRFGSFIGSDVKSRKI